MQEKLENLIFKNFLKLCFVCTKSIALSKSEKKGKRNFKKYFLQVKVGYYPSGFWMWV